MELMFLEYNNYEKFKNNPKTVNNRASQVYKYIENAQELINKASTNENIMFTIKDMRNKLNKLMESGRIEENDDMHIAMQHMIKNFTDLLEKPVKSRSVEEIVYSYSKYDGFNNIYEVCGGNDV
jgi:hypothetical protein